MIFFVLPVYNEERNISAMILSIRKQMVGFDYKIVVVNDGSLDGSLQVLDNLRDERLCVETYNINMNIGAVFATGINRVLEESTSDNDVLLIMESDQTSEIDLVTELIRRIDRDGKDIVIASRYQKGGCYVNFPFFRYLFSLGASYLMRFYFPISGVHDYTIFFRAYRISLFRKAVDYFGSFGLIQSKGFVANAELLIKLSIFTDNIVEVPFVYNYGKKIGKSKLSIFRTINEYFVAIRYLKRIFKKVKQREILSGPVVKKVQACCGK